jgi:hypothetical protein
MRGPAKSWCCYCGHVHATARHAQCLHALVTPAADVPPAPMVRIALDLLDAFCKGGPARGEFEAQLDVVVDAMTFDERHDYVVRSAAPLRAHAGVICTCLARPADGADGLCLFCRGELDAWVTAQRAAAVAQLDTDRAYLAGEGVR